MKKNKIREDENEDVLESSRSREIVSEIINFGVNELQIKKIIKFLSLELEDRNLMSSISHLVDESLENQQTNKSKIEI